MVLARNNGIFAMRQGTDRHDHACREGELSHVQRGFRSMKSKRLIPNLTLIVALLVQLVGIPLFPAAAQAQATPLSVVDNFEAPLAYGVAPDNIQVGFFAAQD